MKCEVLLLKEIDYFKIGDEFGFNQDRFRDAWMKLGGLCLRYGLRRLHLLFPLPRKKGIVSL